MAGFNATYVQNDPATADQEDNDSSVTDYNGHGTMVTGVAVRTAAIFSDGKPRIQVIPVKVLDETGYGTLDQVAKGLRWIIKQKPDIINLSFSGTNDSKILEKLISEASQNKILIISSAGNDFSPDSTWPAANRNVLSVRSAENDGSLSGFTNWGSFVDVFQILFPDSSISNACRDIYSAITLAYKR